MENPVHRQAGQIAFGDTDASGRMHFTNVFRYVEEAEHAFLKSRGIVVFESNGGGWPRVKVSCDFLKPLGFGDEIETLLSITRIGASSLTWEFSIVKTATGETAATGSMTTVLVDAAGQPREIPADYRAALDEV